MCDQAVQEDASLFDFVPEQFRTQAMCESIIEENIYFLMAFQTNLNQKKCVKSPLCFLKMFQAILLRPKYLNCVKM